MKQLSKDEMKKVMGGRLVCEWNCTCLGNIDGSWTYDDPNNQPTSEQRSQDITDYCGGDGECQRPSGC